MSQSRVGDSLAFTATAETTEHVVSTHGVRPNHPSDQVPPTSLEDIHVVSATSLPSIKTEPASIAVSSRAAAQTDLEDIVSVVHMGSDDEESQIDRPSCVGVAWDKLGRECVCQDDLPKSGGGMGTEEFLHMETHMALERDKVLTGNASGEGQNQDVNNELFETDSHSDEQTWMRLALDEEKRWTRKLAEEGSIEANSTLTSGRSEEPSESDSASASASSKGSENTPPTEVEDSVDNLVNTIIHNDGISDINDHTEYGKWKPGIPSSPRMLFRLLVVFAIVLAAVAIAVIVVGVGSNSNAKEHIPVSGQSAAAVQPVTIDDTEFPSMIEVKGSEQLLIGGGTFQEWVARVYTVGVFGHTALVKSMEKKYEQGDVKASHLSQEFSENKLPRTLLLQFHSQISSFRVSRELAKGLEHQGLGDETTSKLRDFITEVVGGKDFENGSKLFFTCNDETLGVSETVEVASFIDVEGLCQALFKAYLGGSVPAFAPIKDGFEKGFVGL
ncbi:hypothetical protein ACHAWF_018321 [Thalassiosira exigua]